MQQSNKIFLNKGLCCQCNAPNSVRIMCIRVFLVRPKQHTVKLGKNPEFGLSLIVVLGQYACGFFCSPFLSTLFTCNPLFYHPCGYRAIFGIILLESHSHEVVMAWIEAFCHYTHHTIPTVYREIYVAHGLFMR